MTLPPGPSSPRIAQTLGWLLRPIPYLQRCRERYGEAFSLTFVGFERPMVMVSDPDVVKAVYSEPANGLPPGRSAVLEPVMGPRSVLLLEGSEHLTMRKLMLPAFHGERMRSYEKVMSEAINAEIDSWPLARDAGRGFPIHPRMQAVTLEVILKAVFGISEGERYDRLRANLRELLRQTESPAAQAVGLAVTRLGAAGRFVPGAGKLREFEQLLGQTDGLLLAEIEERRTDPDLEDREDILSMLVGARYEDGEPISDAELRDQLVTLLLAGHETTATALAWGFELLLRDPVRLGRLREEIEAGEEEYLRAAITEILRLRPVVPIAGRRLAGDVRAGGLDLPAGTDVAPAIWLTHTRADVYPDPFAFRPERFLDSGPETYSWIPFGGGVRRCLGAAFAEFEIRIVLTEVLRRCKLEPLLTGPQHVARRNITLSPKQGTPVRLLSREPAREPAAA